MNFIHKFLKKLSLFCNRNTQLTALEKLFEAQRYSSFIKMLLRAYRFEFKPLQRQYFEPMVKLWT